MNGIVNQLIRMKFSEFAAASEAEILSGQHEKDIELAGSKCELAKKYLLDQQKGLDDYKGETLRVIRGQSKLSLDLLNTLVAEAELQIQEAQASADTAKADLYDKSSFEAKKGIVSQFIKAVRVGRDYNIEVDFNVSFEALQGFCTGNSRQDKMQAPESRTA